MSVIEWLRNEVRQFLFKRKLLRVAARNGGTIHVDGEPDVMIRDEDTGDVTVAFRKEKIRGWNA